MTWHNNFFLKIPPGNRVYQTRVRVLKSSFPIFISSHASLTLILPHLTLSLPHASAPPPPPSSLPHTPASIKPPSRLLQPHVTPPSASPHASPPGISNPPCSSFLSLAWGVQREDNSLSLWFGVCKGRKISLCSFSLSGNRLIQKKKL